VADVAALLDAGMERQAATTMLTALARARLAPRVVLAAQPGRARPRPGTVAVRIVSAADEARLTPLVRRAAERAADRHLAAQLVAIGLGLALGPEAGLAGDLATLAVPGPGRALPPGTRAGDVLLCIPVWWLPPGRITRERAGLLRAAVRAGRLVAWRVAGAARC
jgi:hypothetical protein